MTPFVAQLETGRLLLRQWRPEDFDAYAAICADPKVMTWLGGKTFSTLEAWRHMAYLIGHWQLRGYGHWAVEEKQTGKFIGRLGFFYPEGWPGFEIGWTLAHDAWGKGYATEGARAALHEAFTTMDRDRVISVIHPDNRNSIRVVEKLGGVLDGHTEVLGIGVDIYAISRDRYMTLDADRAPAKPETR